METPTSMRIRPLFSQAKHHRLFCMAFTIAITTILAVLFGTTASYADIYGYQDKDGHWHFPGLQSGKSYRLRVNAERLKEYEVIINRASEIFGIESSLIKAVIKAESDFNSAAVSKKGAKGLMQLMPLTADALEVKDPFEPDKNIFGGTRYLKQLLQRFDNDKMLALAAYNAGPETVLLHKGVPPYPETRNFVQRVLSYYRSFRSFSR